MVTTGPARAELIRTLRKQGSVSIAVHPEGDDPKQARLSGLAFSVVPHAGWFVPLPADASKAATMLSEFRSLLEDEQIEKVGHDLKSTLTSLKWNGLSVRGKLFDVMLAHALIEPDMRHTLEFLAEVHLGYTPASAGQAAGGQTELGLGDTQPSAEAEHAVETADIAWQLRAILEPKLKSQERVFYEIEAPLLPALVDME